MQLLPVLVNDIDLHSISHRFQFVADYWSDFRCRQGISLFNTLVPGGERNSQARNLASQN